jgi:hypothetical protein
MINSGTGLDTDKTEELLERNRAVPINSADFAELVAALQQFVDHFGDPFKRARAILEKVKT